MILRPLAVACTAISLKLAHVESNKALIVQGSSVYSLVCTDISNQLEGLYKEEWNRNFKGSGKKWKVIMGGIITESDKNT